MNLAVASLHARFPGLETFIARRCEEDDAFRELCDDLAEAETVLCKLEQSACSQERLVEYRSLVSSLFSEIASEIGTGQVISFRRQVIS